MARDNKAALKFNGAGSHAVLNQPIMSRNTPTEQVLFAVLRSGISVGVLFDTQLRAFSRRTDAGQVDTLRAVFANSTALKNASEYFSRLLSTEWADIESSDSEVEYDYESDSDLEDTDDGEDVNDYVFDELPFAMRSALAADDEKSESTKSADEDVDDAFTLSKLDATLMTSSTAEVSCNIAQITRTLPAVAHKTLEAFVYYTMTGKIEFAPLKSQPPSVRREKAQAERKPFDPPLCSPKSMYRFAHMCEMDQLKNLALKDIESKLSVDNILEELFSRLTCRYLELQKLEVSYLLKNLSANLMSFIPGWIAKVASGELGPMGGDVLAILFEKLAEKVISLNDKPALKCRYCYSTNCNRRCHNCGRNF
ncbi:uncharacterized protein LAESUDRAFT_723932 [Laetiporus sulphureus 93-53]|uniref:BTB domain-containing protein n=1 Tax=Laetiporus sulphureus 93-53 TaxID=1314785 RepID=A0A165F557_9APHY|nr:uncharacterized protein LAESUDRAFT_723932 [Laetiporus sulphureus 93-53]KZT08413.1 hypothetical protein LAESUDRAFT_723932 [Laetiporus sulphureus 93-53]